MVGLRADCARNTPFEVAGGQVRRLVLELLGQEEQTSLSVKIFAEEFLGVVKFHHVFQQQATRHNVGPRVFAHVFVGQRAFPGVAEQQQRGWQVLERTAHADIVPQKRREAARKGVAMKLNQFWRARGSVRADFFRGSRWRDDGGIFSLREWLKS